jgi:hypothetical protein
MRIIAPMMILIMMTSTLAGCTGGDPDSGGEMDTDAINDLIDANLQDFINNTTITVNQEIHHHYYNNTTVNEGDMTNNDYNTEYNNTTINEVVQTNSEIYTFDRTFTDRELFLENFDHRNNSITGVFTLFDFGSSQSYSDTVTIDCGVYYIVGSDDFNSWNENSSLWAESYWVNSDWYGTGWAVYESLGYEGYNITMIDLYHSIAWNYDVRMACDETHPMEGYSIDIGSLVVFSLEIPQGYAISCQYSAFPSFYYQDEEGLWNGGTNSILKIDGLNFQCGNLIGGSNNMTFEILRGTNDYSETLSNDRMHRIVFTFQIIPVSPVE